MNQRRADEDVAQLLAGDFAREPEAFRGGDNRIAGAVEDEDGDGERGQAAVWGDFAHFGLVGRDFLEEFVAKIFAMVQEKIEFRLAGGREKQGGLARGFGLFPEP